MIEILFCVYYKIGYAATKYTTHCAKDHYMSFNPVKDAFNNQQLYGSREVMTQSGTLAKISYLLFVLLAGAGLGSFLFATMSPFIGAALIGGIILSLASAIIGVFAPHLSSYTAMPYAFGQGLALSILAQGLEILYPGIAISAVTLSGATAVAMLLLYRFEVIQVTDTLRSVLLTATAAIGVTYLVVFLLWLIGINTTPFYESSSLLSIGFSFFVVGIAAFNLLLDFDLIEKGSERGLPKFMEWYAAFSLLVTLIWLYLEIVRLLIKVSRRRS